jgi:glycosyltransferase involved in cell wall biosynthesis
VNNNNILIISYLDYPYYVGLSRRISGIAEILSENGLKVLIIAPIARLHGQIKKQTPENVLISRINLAQFGSGTNYNSKLIQWLLFSFIASFEVIRQAANRHTIVQYQSTFSAIPAIIAKVFLGSKIVGDDIVPINAFIDTFTLNLTDIVTTPSPLMFERAKKLRKKTLLVPNGVKLASCSKRLRREEKRLKLIFVGALSFSQNVKAVENIIEIAKELENRKVKFDISIVGGPLNAVSFKANSSVALNGRIKFLGQITDEELLDLYKSSDVGLLPFFQDIPLLGGQRTKALEFFSHSLLVVSGENGVKGIGGLISGRHFLLAKDRDDMTRVLVDCLSNPARYEKIAEDGAAFVAKHYSWDVLTKNYIAEIKKSFSREVQNVLK